MKKAFTLAEVLITLAIIGVVAALTIPTLVTNYQAKQYETAKKVLISNLTSATRNMQVDEKLMGYETTADFVKQFQNYIKIIKICDNNHLSECFDTSFYVDGKEITIDKVKTSSNLGKDYNDNNIGVVFADGVSAILTYNPECTVSGMNFQKSSSCLGMIYDLNGKKSPNNDSSDLGFINASLKNGVTVAEFKAACEYSVNAYETSINCQCGPACSGMANSLNLEYSGTNASSLDVFECACEGSCLVDSNIVTSCSIDD